MFREITLGQYYPVDSAVHRLDPRTKLFGTMVFIASLFVADNIWGYVIATVVLAAVIKLTKVPVRFILRGLKAIMILLLISVSFNLFLTDGRILVKFWIFKITFEGAYLSGHRFIRHDADHHAEPADRRSGEGPWFSEAVQGADPRGCHDDVHCPEIYSHSGGGNR